MTALPPVQEDFKSRLQETVEVSAARSLPAQNSALSDVNVCSKALQLYFA